jgi:hypothetical protein
MMEAQSPRRHRFALAALACFLVSLFASAPAAFAVQSSQYDVFQNPISCPTSSPYLNNPEFPGAACVATTAGHLSLKFGNIETDTSTPTTLGFALSSTYPGLKSGSCPPGVEECFNAVPGSTVLGVEPISVDLPVPGHHHGPPHFHFPSFHPNHGGHWNPWHGHGRRMLNDFPHPSVKATVEPAGDVRAFLFAAEPGTPSFTLLLKVHLEGPSFGHDCYIGSNASPIEIPIFALAEPKLNFLEDPNGLPVFTAVLEGLDTGSNIFSVPAAQGCGPLVGLGKHKYHLLDDAINSALDLPSPPGENLIALTGSKTAAVVSGSGGLLQAAFEAAKAP